MFGRYGWQFRTGAFAVILAGIVVIIIRRSGIVIGTFRYGLRIVGSILRYGLRIIGSILRYGLPLVDSRIAAVIGFQRLLRRLFRLRRFGRRLDGFRFPYRRKLHAPRYHLHIGAAYLSAIVRRHGVARGVAVAYRSDISRRRAVTDKAAPGVRLPAAFPAHVVQRQRPSVFLHGFRNQRQVRVGQIGIKARRAHGAVAGRVLRRLHGHRFVVKPQNAGVAVLCRDLHCGVQSLENLLHFVRFAGFRDGSRDLSAVRSGFLLAGHIDHMVYPSVVLKVPRRNAGRVVHRGKLINPRHMDGFRFPGREHLRPHGLIGIPLRRADGNRRREQSQNAQRHEKSSHAPHNRFLPICSCYSWLILTRPLAGGVPLLEIFVPIFSLFRRPNRNGVSPLTVLFL